MTQTLKQLNIINTKVINVLEYSVVKYGFIILIILFIILIKYIPTWYLVLYNKIWVKVILVFILAYSACFDPIYAIAITTMMIISMQELHKRGALETMVNIKSIVSSNIDIINPKIVINDKMAYDIINKASLQKIPERGDAEIIGEYDYYSDPAYGTLTENISKLNSLKTNSFYEYQDELIKAQTNVINPINQSMLDTQGIQGILGTQGIPYGYDKNMMPLDEKLLN